MTDSEPMKWMISSLFAALLVNCLLMTACSAPSARIGGFESDNPATLLFAIQEAGESRDRSAVPNLVEALENDDPAVRMMAIVSLERITGERLGYKPYTSSVLRAPAVARWQAMVRGETSDKADKADQSDKSSERSASNLHESSADQPTADTITNVH